MQTDRFIVIVLDGVGAGEAPDAADYGDVGANSLGNTARAVGGLRLPNLEALGFGYITPMLGVAQPDKPGGSYGRLAPASAGKDTISGHWELMGVTLARPFPLYPHGFPPEVMDEFERRIGRGTLGNIPASGTEIIKELGMEHLRSGKPIVYTSGDSVFQIAANEAVIPIDELYRMCHAAREILAGEHAVGRVIARPFIGDRPENFQRTERRHDYPLLPPEETILQKCVAAGLVVASVGKIDDIFAQQGISRSRHTLNNVEGLHATLEFMKQDFRGLLFTNLIEFDMIYGHRNDAPGYAAALERVDAAVPEMLKRMRPGDVLAFVADHGVDPTTPGTDHTRECSPLLMVGASVRPGVDLGLRTAFSDVGATIAQVFGLEPPSRGTSFWDEIEVDKA